MVLDEPHQEKTVDVAARVGAFVLLTGGLTMVFLAAATLASNELLALPAMVAPGVVGLGLAIQHRLDLAEVIGLRFRVGVAVLALVTGPFIVVLAMVLTGTARTLTSPMGLSFWLALGGVVVAELGWWGYLYPAIRMAWPPLQSSMAVGLIWAGWHGLLAWAGANPLEGATPVLLVPWALAVALVASALLEFRPSSVIPVSAFQLGLAAAAAALTITPLSGRGPAAMRTAIGLLVAAGLVAMVMARREAVKRARHSDRPIP